MGIPILTTGKDVDPPHAALLVNLSEAKFGPDQTQTICTG